MTILAGLKNKLGPKLKSITSPARNPARIFPGLFETISGTKPPPPPTEAEIAEPLRKPKPPQPGQTS